MQTMLNRLWPLLLTMVLVMSSPVLTAPVKTTTALLSNERPHAGSRQLLQLRDKAGWIFGKAKSPDTDTAGDTLELTPAETAQRAEAGREADVAALMEIKASLRPESQSFLSLWVKDGEPCKYPKVTCDSATGRVSEINLAVTENLALLYPELRSVITAFEQNQTADQEIATTKRALAEASVGQASWEDSSIPGSATAWPSGNYPYSSITFNSLPCGSAFMQLNQTLRALHMSNAAVLDPTLPPAWGVFTHLRELTLTGLGLKGSLPAEWSGMINITQLVLSDNHQLRGSLPASWGSMTRLKLLDLSVNHANGLRSSISGSLPSSWSNMVKLETLNLWRTSLVGHLPSSWVGMKRLQVLSLSDTGISGSLPSAWGSKMPKLATVHVANTLIGGALPASWAKMKKLALLDLRGTSVQQPVPPSWLALCKRNGTQVWDNAQHSNTWPPNLQYGRVTHVFFPWASSDGSLWEINHDDTSTCNMCHHLASGYTLWGTGVLLLCIGAVVSAFVAYRISSGPFFKLHGQRFD